MDDEVKPEATTSMGGGAAVNTSTPRLRMNLGAAAAYSIYDADQESEDDQDSFSASEEVGVMKVIVKLPTSASAGDDLALSVSQNASVLDLKRRITDELALTTSGDAIPVERQRLIFSGRMLTNNDDFLLDDVKMKVDGPNYVHLAPIPQGLQPSRRDRASYDDIDFVTSDEEERPPLRRARLSRHVLSRETRRSQASPYGGFPFSQTLLGAASSSGRHLRRPRHLEVETDQRSQLPDIPVYAAPRQPTAIPSAALSVHPLMCQSQEQASVLVGTQPLGFDDTLALSSLDSVVRPMGPTMVNSLALDGSSLGLSSRQGLSNGVQMDIWRRTNELLPLIRMLPDQLIRVLSSSGSDTDHLRELRYQTELEDAASLLEQVAQRSSGLATSFRHFSLTRRQHLVSHPPHSSATVPTTTATSNPMADLLSSFYQGPRAERLRGIYPGPSAPYY